MSKELASRLIIGPLFAAILIGLIVWDMLGGSHWGAFSLAAFAVLVGSFELAALLRPFAPGMQPVLLAATNLCIVWTAWPGFPAPATMPVPINYGVLVIGVSLAVLSLAQMARYGLDHFLPNVLGSAFALCYLGGALHLLLALAISEGQDNPLRGSQLLLVAIAAVKMGDTFAYFGGRALGKHKLCPGISPGKTVEGFLISIVGSITGALLTAWILAATTDQAPFTAWWHGIIWGVIVGPVGALGDLVESCLKRSVQAKDSGSVLLGFGGFLDVFDAILLAAPIACLLALLF